jgi:hypothetical protein
VIDPQDPLPEPTWLFRRLFVWTVTAWALALVTAIVVLRADADVTVIAVSLLAANALRETLYLLAPTGEVLAQIFAALPRGVGLGRTGPAQPAPAKPAAKPEAFQEGA